MTPMCFSVSALKLNLFEKTGHTTNRPHSRCITDNNVSGVKAEVEMNNVTTLIKQEIIFLDKENKCKATNMTTQTMIHNF